MIENLFPRGKQFKDVSFWCIAKKMYMVVGWNTDDNILYLSFGMQLILCVLSGI
jgi:hypothetical protein